MRIPLAWKTIIHSRTRSLLTVAGMSFAILMLFMQLGMYSAVLSGAMLIYDQLEFDLVIVSSNYRILGLPDGFSRRRLAQARGVDGVASADPFHVRGVSWIHPDLPQRRMIMALAFDPDDDVFRTPAIRSRRNELRQTDVLLVDSETRPMFGPRHPGTCVELQHRKCTILGEYDLGTGFLELGIMLTSDANLARLFDQPFLNDVSVGLVKTDRNQTANTVARRLRRVLPADVRVLTRDELNRTEPVEWITRTSTGFILGSSVLVALIVAVVILSQALAAQVTDHLAEYAMLKAFGHRDSYLRRTVLEQAWLMTLLAFTGAWLLAFPIYQVVSWTTHMTVRMTFVRVVLVLLLSFSVSTIAGLLALRRALRADPAELF